LNNQGVAVATFSLLTHTHMATASTAVAANQPPSGDERRQKVLADYRRRLLESRELEDKVKQSGFYLWVSFMCYMCYMSYMSVICVICVI
jgi:hypothetical protein